MKVALWFMKVAIAINRRNPNAEVIPFFTWICHDSDNELFVAPLHRFWNTQLLIDIRFHRLSFNSSPPAINSSLAFISVYDHSILHRHPSICYRYSIQSQIVQSVIARSILLWSLTGIFLWLIISPWTIKYWSSQTCRRFYAISFSVVWRQFHHKYVNNIILWLSLNPRHSSLTLHISWPNVIHFAVSTHSRSMISSQEVDEQMVNIQIGNCYCCIQWITTLKIWGWLRDNPQTENILSSSFHSDHNPKHTADTASYHSSFPPQHIEHCADADP
jgi:hypothetical protein